MDADSKDVAKALKSDVFPILRAAGFAVLRKPVQPARLRALLAAPPARGHG